MLGLGGYYIGAHSKNAGVEVANTTTSPSPRKPVYGTPEDFARAIEELRASFAEAEQVTTVPEQLVTHGFSPNSHLPGAPSFHFELTGSD